MKRSARLSKLFAALLLAPGLLFLWLWAWPRSVNFPLPFTSIPRPLWIGLALVALALLARFSRPVVGFSLVVPIWFMLVGIPLVMIAELHSAGRGMWIATRPHERYGSQYYPWASGFAFQLGEYSVQCSQDEKGWRYIDRPATGDDVVLLGCSFTYGAGVGDRDVYASRLQSLWPRVRIHNHSNSGWGTSQAYRVLEDDLASMPNLKLVLYGWIEGHLPRNAMRKSFYAKANNTAPFFEVENGKPVFRRMVPAAEAQAPDSDETTAKEIATTFALLEEMNRMCAAKGVRFVVAALRQNDSPSSDPIMDGLTSHDIEWIDLRALPGSFYPIDKHPREDWHEAVARGIAERIKL
jgi:hypothetical protein